MSDTTEEKGSHCLRYLLKEEVDLNWKKIQYIKETPLSKHTTIQCMKEPPGSNHTYAHKHKELQ